MQVGLRGSKGKARVRVFDYRSPFRVGDRVVPLPFSSSCGGVVFDKAPSCSFAVPLASIASRSSSVLSADALLSTFNSISGSIVLLVRLAFFFGESVMLASFFRFFDAFVLVVSPDPPLPRPLAASPGFLFASAQGEGVRGVKGEGNVKCKMKDEL